MRKYCVVVLLLFLAGVLAGSPAQAKLSKEAKEWMNGPVRYLMSQDERKVFKDLDGEEAVEQFKKDFWAKRDPIPETGTNEFKIRFEERVAFADQNFKSWRSDRGMVFILLGPPQDRSDSPLGADISVAGSEIWTYAAIKEQRTRTNYSIFFYDQDGNGDYDMWVGQDLGGNPPDGIERCDIVFTDPKIIGLEPLPEEFRAVVDAPTATVAAPPAQPTVSSASAAFVDRVIAGEEPLSDLNVAHSAYCFKDDKGTTLVVINVGVFTADQIEDPGFVPFARLVSATGESYSFESEASFSPWKDNDKIADDFLVYQAQGSVPAGQYQLYGGVYHKGDNKAGTFSEELKAPEFHAGAFSLSSIVVANEMKGDPTRSGEGKISAKPFTLGGTTILPNVDHVYTKKQELAVFFQAYDGQKNLETDQYIFRLQYRFFYEKDGRFVPYGKPKMVESDSPGQGYFVPLATLRSGKYKLIVSATDMMTEQTAKSTTYFELVD